MKRILWVTLLFLSFRPMIAGAAPVTAEQASLVAKNISWIYNDGNMDFYAISPVLLLTRMDGETPVYHVFGYANQPGFVLVAATDNVIPVLAYSFESSFPMAAEDTPPQLRGMLDYYAAQIVDAIEKSLPPDQDILNQWAYFQSIILEPAYNPALIVGPLLTTLWDQGCYYNASCPSTGGSHPAGPCSHVLTGCVATAMAQVINYHNYPPRGTGSHSYTDPANGTDDPSYGTVSVTYSYVYDWDNMPNTVSAANTDVANLMFHCGVSVNMDYAYYESGSYTADVAAALEDHFYYSTTANFVEKSSYSSTGWNNLMKAEVDNARVVQYRGQTSTGGGHSFVMDGYNDNYNNLGVIWFHFNWGWSGSANGYYSTTNLNPGSNFSTSQGAVVGIEPKPVNLTYDETYHSKSISGNDATIYARVENIGTGLAGASELGYYLSTNTTISSLDWLIGTDAVPILVQGGYSSESIIVDMTAAFPTIPPGDYYLGYLVDRLNDVVETTSVDNDYAFPGLVTVNCKTPDYLSASDGVYYDKVYLSWPAPDYATHYKVYRNTTNNSATATAITGWQTQTTYYDYEAIPDQTYYYWVKSANSSSGAHASSMSTGNSGYAVLQAMTQETEYTVSTDPRYFKFNSSYSYWSVVGVRNNVSGEDWDITLFSDVNMGSSLVYSMLGSNVVDFVVTDANHVTATDYRGIRFSRYSGSGSAVAEFEGSSEILYSGTNGTYTWNSGELVEIWDMYLSPGYYSIQLDHLSGTANLDIGIFSSQSGDYYQSRNDMLTYSTQSGTTDEIIYFKVETGDYYGVIVWANDLNAATYALKVGKGGTWTGTVDNNWHNPLNWSANYIPLAEMDVIIPAGVPNFPKVINDSARCNKLTIAAGASLEIGDRRLRVHDSLIVSGYVNLSGAAAEIWAMSSIIWESGSTAASVTNGEFYVYGNWVFMEGTAVSLTYGYTEFRGAGNGYIRCYESNAKINNIRNMKGVLFGISALSTDNLTVAGNIFNYSNKMFVHYSPHTLFLGGTLQNLGGDFQFQSGSLVFNGSPAYSLKPGHDSYLKDLTINITNTLSLGGDYCDSLFVNGNLLIQAGAVNAGSMSVFVTGNWTNQQYPGGFLAGTSEVVFHGGNYHQYCSSESFYLLRLNKAAGGAFRVNGGTVSCNAYDWTAGAVDVLSGTFTANDLIDNGIYGNFYVNPGGVINLTNSDGWVDLNGNLYIYGGGINVYGGTSMSYWPYAANASITMTDGVLDFKNQGIRLYTTMSAVTLTNNISGGVIRTAGGFYGLRPDFHPTAGTVELYGSNPDNIGSVPGFAFNKLRINKGGLSTATATATLDINSDFSLEAGRFSISDTMYVGGNWDNQAGTAAFIENTSRVIFDGSSNASIKSNETFYNMNLSKPIPGSNALVLYGDKVLTVSNDLRLQNACFTLNNNTILNIGNDLILSSGAGLHLSGFNCLVNIEGDWNNYNTGISTDYGFIPGMYSTVAFKGSVNQTLSTSSTQESFNNLTIDKALGSFRPNDAVFVSGNTTIINGIWEDNVSNLTHTLEGDFIVQSGGALYNAFPQNTINFFGNANASLSYLSGTGYFHNISINKSVGVSVVQNGYTSCQFEGELNVNSGTYNLNGNSIFVTGDVIVGPAGKLKIPSASWLKLSGGNSLDVNYGGTLSIEGSPLNNAGIQTFLGTEYFNLNVNAGATISARYAQFQNTGNLGVSINAGAIVDIANAFKGCTFQQGIPGGRLLTINNSQTFTVDSAVFPANSWGGAYNVSKIADDGFVTFTHFSGDFAGEDFDNDYYNRIEWLTAPGGGTIDGYVKYDNAGSVPVTTATVKLKSGPDIVTTTTTNTAGFYSFSSIPPGSYTLQSTTTAGWGGANSADALLIQKHFVGLSPLVGLRLKAGDVNNSGFINVTDALLVARRFTGIITSFAAGDWHLESWPLTIAGTGTVSQNIKAICFGDVNASYPGPYKTPALFSILPDGAIPVHQDDIVDIPLSLSREAPLGAISLVMDYPKEKIEILSVEPGPQGGEVVYKVTGEGLRIAWYDDEDEHFAANEVILNLKVRLRGIPESMPFMVMPESELNDHQGNVLGGLDLLCPQIKSSAAGDQVELPWPNPFSDATSLMLSLKEPAVVAYSLVNLSGQTIREMRLGEYPAGVNKVVVDGSDLAEGSYYCVVKIFRCSQIVSKYVKLAVIR